MLIILGLENFENYVYNKYLQNNINQDGDSGDIIWLILVGVDITFLLIVSKPLWLKKECDHGQYLTQAKYRQGSIIFFNFLVLTFFQYWLK